MTKRFPTIMKRPEALQTQLYAETDSKKHIRWPALSLRASGRACARQALGP